MSQIRIKLNETADVREFVKAAEKCDVDVDICCGSAMVDAKSILGIISLGLAKILTVQCHGDSSDFVREISRFAVA